MTWFRWWHRFVRLHFKPKSEELALRYSSRLSWAYAFFGWNALGFVLYNCLKQSRTEISPEDELTLSPGQRLAKAMGRENASVYRLSGFKLEKINPVSKEESQNENNVG